MVQGMQVHEGEDGRTLDLTKIRLSFGQVILVFGLLSGMAGTAAVMMWRVDTNSVAIEKMANTVDKLADNVDKVARVADRNADRLDAMEGRRSSRDHDSGDPRRRD